MAKKYGGNDDVLGIDDACRLAQQFGEMAVALKDFFKAQFTAPNSESQHLTFCGEVAGSNSSFLLMTPFGQVRADYLLKASAPREYFGKLTFSRVPELEPAPTARPVPFYEFVFDHQGYASLDTTPDQEWSVWDKASHVSQRVARALALQILGSLADSV